VEKERGEERGEEEESLLKELCGDDAKLYDFLSRYMYENPLEANIQKGSRYPHRGGGKKPGTLDRQ